MTDTPSVTTIQSGALLKFGESSGSTPRGFSWLSTIGTMSEYQPRAAHGDLKREAASARAPTDELRNYTSGSVGKPRISPPGDMIRARNGHKPRVLMD